MPQILVALVALATLSAWVPAQAAPMNRPQAEYSADSTIQNEEGTIQQRVYVTPTKERKEILTGSGDGAVQIFRYDNKVMWMLMPSEKMYMEHSIAGGPSKGNDPSQWTYEDTAVGEETLNGMKVTKYKTIATSTDGKKFGGFSWRTKRGHQPQAGSALQGRQRKEADADGIEQCENRQARPKTLRDSRRIHEIGHGRHDGRYAGMGRPGQPMGRPDMSGTPPPNTRKPDTRPEVVTPQEPPASEQEPPAESQTWTRPPSS